MGLVPTVPCWAIGPGWLGGRGGKWRGLSGAHSGRQLHIEAGSSSGEGESRGRLDAGTTTNTEARLRQLGLWEELGLSARSQQTLPAATQCFPQLLPLAEVYEHRHGSKHFL